MDQVLNRIYFNMDVQKIEKLFGISAKKIEVKPRAGIFTLLPSASVAINLMLKNRVFRKNQYFFQTRLDKTSYYNAYNSLEAQLIFQIKDTGIGIKHIYYKDVADRVTWIIFQFKTQDDYNLANTMYNKIEVINQDRELAFFFTGKNIVDLWKQNLDKFMEEENVF